MFRIKQRSSLVRSLAIAAAAVAIAAVTAGPAAAWPVDHPRSSGRTSTSAATGTLPSRHRPPGNLRWDTTGGIVTPTLSGKLFMNNVNGLRGRLRIDYYDAAHNRITLRHSTWRTAGPGFNAFDFVDFKPFGASNVYGVEANTSSRTQRESSPRSAPPRRPSSRLQRGPSAQQGSALVGSVMGSSRNSTWTRTFGAVVPTRSGASTSTASSPPALTRGTLTTWTGSRSTPCARSSRIRAAAAGPSSRDNSERRQRLTSSPGRKRRKRRVFRRVFSVSMMVGTPRGLGTCARQGEMGCSPEAAACQSLCFRAYCSARRRCCASIWAASIACLRPGDASNASLAAELLITSPSPLGSLHKRPPGRGNSSARS